MWIYQFKIRRTRGHPVPQSAAGDDWEATALRFAEAVTAIWEAESKSTGSTNW